MARNTMGKVIALLLIILLALTLVAGYLGLTEKIIAGEGQMAEGQRQFDRGQPALEEGKAELKAGKRELSAGEKEYKHARHNLFLVLADKLLEGGKGFREARKRIVEGDKQVAKGEGEVSAGEKRLDAGGRELCQGREQLRLAKGIRVACAFGAAFLASLAIVLGFRWRRSLARVFRQTDA